MVTRLLGLDTPPKPADAADALALAICHVWRGGTQSRLEEARLEVLARTGNPGGGIPRRLPPGAAQSQRRAPTSVRTAQTSQSLRQPRANPGAQPR
jgi:crossover junction endodeoxyribonuclease RuvC